MPPIVFDAKMRVADDIVGEHAEDLIDSVLLVAELMAERDAAAVHGADSKDESDNRPPGQALRSHEDRRGKEARPVERHRRYREVAIIAVGLHRAENFRGRVFKILAEPGVGDRDDPEDENQRNQRRDQRAPAEEV